MANSNTVLWTIPLYLYYFYNCCCEIPNFSFTFSSSSDPEQRAPKEDVVLVEMWP